MSYYHARTLDLGFDEAIERVTETLKAEGFGILTEIDVAATFKKKLDVDFRAYRILGACNPPAAHKALQAEPHIGTMLPCNVVVQDAGEGKTEVFAVDPIASMASVDNAELGEIATEIRDRLQRAVDAI